MAGPILEWERKPYVITSTMSAIMLCCLFLANMSYLYGLLYKSDTRVHKLNVLAVDYDRGAIGQSFTAAYSAFKGDEFLSLQFRQPSEYANTESVRNAVCRGDFWAAVVVQSGATARFEEALGGGQAATQYNASNTITYIWNEAHYATVQAGFIRSNLETLIGASGTFHSHISGVRAVASVNTTDPNAVFALLNPIQASAINIMPTPQSTRVFYNTVTVVLSILPQFFFIMALNGISDAHSIYSHLHTRQVVLIRTISSIIFTLIASLTVIGYIWAFRETWAVNGSQFVLSWLILWLFMHVNFLVIDTASSFIPISFLPFFILTWIITNVAGTVFPFELTAGFYRVGYALPSHPLITIFFQIWSGGCNNKLSSALPVLFAWEILGLGSACLGLLRRIKNARKVALQKDNLGTAALSVLTVDEYLVEDAADKRKSSVELGDMRYN